MMTRPMLNTLRELFSLALKAIALLLLLAIAGIVLIFGTAPRSRVVLTNRTERVITECTLLVETEFWWNQNRRIGPLAPGSSARLSFQRLDESSFTVHCRFDDGHVVHVQTGNFWDPAPGDSTLWIDVNRNDLRFHEPELPR